MMKTASTVAATAAASTLSLLAAEPSAAARPNVVFILADDFGWRDAAVYGSTFYQTPNIDALAKSGMLFTDAYSANPLCSPTRASILSGQYPLRHGLTTASGHIAQIQQHKECTSGPGELRGCGPSSLNYLDPKHYTLGKAMKAAGYATGFFGKWHLGHDAQYYPENHGFDTVKGGRSHSGPPGTNPARRFYPPWDCDTLKPYPSADTHVDDYITDLAIRYIRKQKDDKKPFFVCYWAYSVHAPFQSKPELIEKWKQKADPLNPQHSPTMAAMIEVLDTNVGRLMQALQDNGLADNTIVIFTSDNGGNTYETVDGTTPTSNHPLRSGKGNTREGGVRVPLVVRWPGVTKPGSINPAVVSSVDHYPTILEMTGQALRPADHKDGVSYALALQGKPYQRGPMICDMPHPVLATYNIPNTFVRIGEWKMTRFWFDNPKDQSHRYELYNLSDDIGEAKDLSATEPERLKAMSAVLDQYYQETGVLGYHPNSKYSPPSVGTWFAVSGEGTMAAKDGALVIQSEKPGYTVKTRFFPPGGRDGFLVFEARSPSKTTLTLAGPGKGKTISPTESWQEFALSAAQIFMNGEKFRVTLPQAGEVELRNVRVTTADKTEMIRFKFY